VLADFLLGAIFLACVVLVFMIRDMLFAIVMIYRVVNYFAQKEKENG